MIALVREKEIFCEITRKLTPVWESGFFFFLYFVLFFSPLLFSSYIYMYMIPIYTTHMVSPLGPFSSIVRNQTHIFSVSPSLPPPLFFI